MFGHYAGIKDLLYLYSRKKGKEESERKRGYQNLKLMEI